MGNNNSIVFKKGPLSNLQNMSSVDAGTLYFTEDEGGLYLGVKQGDDKPAKLKRMQGTVLYFNTMEEAAPVAAIHQSNVLYYIANGQRLGTYVNGQWQDIILTAEERESIDINFLTIKANIGVLTTTSAGLAETTSALQASVNAINESIKLMDGRVDDLEAEVGDIDDGVREDLNEAISVETTRALAAESSLDNKITEEIKRATAAELSLDNKITEEINRAIAAESSLEGDLQDATDQITSIKETIAEHGTRLGVVEVQCKDLTITTADHEDRLAYLESYDMVNDLDFINTEAIPEIHRLIADNVEDITLLTTRVEKNEKDIKTNVAGISENKKNIESLSDTKLDIDGSKAMTGNLNMGGKQINNVTMTTEPDELDVANVKYVRAQATDIAALRTSIDSMFKNETDKITAQKSIDLGSQTLSNIQLKPSDTNSAATIGYVQQMLAANDAMTFKGVLNNPSQKYSGASSQTWESLNEAPRLPTQADVGDVYKVGKLGYYTYKKKNDDGVFEDNVYAISAKIGDLIINAAEKDEDCPNWEHISSGYEDDYVQKMMLDTTNQIIYLNDGVHSFENLSGFQTGALAFTGKENSNLTFKISEKAIPGAVHQINNITVSADLVWGTF